MHSKAIKRVVLLCLLFLLTAFPAHANAGKKLLSIKDGSLASASEFSPWENSLIFQQKSLLQQQSMKLTVMPVDGRMTSGFGPRKVSRKGATRMHKGIDISAPKGTCVIAAASGVVTAVGTRRGYGKTVDIDHGNGLITRYAHLSSYSVQQGDTLNAGDSVGFVGRTGRTTGNCLHFETILHGEQINPLEASLWENTRFAEAGLSLESAPASSAGQRFGAGATGQGRNNRLHDSVRAPALPSFDAASSLQANTLP